MKEEQDNKKRFLIALLLLALIGVTGGWAAYSSGALDQLHSPNHSSARHRPQVSQTHGMTTVLKERLGLDDKQTAAVEKIGKEIQDKLMKLKKDDKMPVGQFRKESQKIMDEGSAKLKKVLNIEQQAKFEKMKLEMKEGHKM